MNKQLTQKQNLDELMKQTLLNNRKSYYNFDRKVLIFLLIL